MHHLLHIVAHYLKRCCNPFVHSVRPSVRPSVFSLSFEPTGLWSWSFACVWVTTMACTGLKLKFTG